MVFIPGAGMIEQTESAAKIRGAIERNVKAVSLRASVGKGTAVTRASLGDGLACAITDGEWSFTAGMSEKYGGSNAGPNPGVYGRAALASCLAIGYGMWAARMEIPLTSLDVEVQADYDVRGELGVSEDVRPGYLAVRYLVTVESSAPREDVIRMLDTADKNSSWRDDYARDIPLAREVRISSPGVA
jgi:uncharacterized OsmC-like protein